MTFATTCLQNAYTSMDILDHGLYVPQGRELSHAHKHVGVRGKEYAPAICIHDPAGARE